MQYVKLDDEQTGETRVVAGPALVFPGPYEVARPPADKTVLAAGDAVRVTNNTTGEERIVKGPATFVPGTAGPDGPGGWGTTGILAVGRTCGTRLLCPAPLPTATMLVSVAQ